MPRVSWATEIPILVSPNDSSTVSTSSLTWQAVTGVADKDPYRIQVDDDSSFGSPNKDTYTDNLSYKPVLTNGVWYWRVKAKDTANIWSDWSVVRSFNLGTDTASTPSPSPSATNSPTPQPTSQAAPTPSPVSNIFQISNTPNSVRSDQSFSVSIDMTGLDPNTAYFLKGAFHRGTSTNYFGQTQVGGSWIKNSQPFNNQLSITSDNAGKWHGTITIMADIDDSGFTGSSNYNFKVGRYNASGSGPIWSNEVALNITQISTPAPSATSKPISTPTQTATPTTVPAVGGVNKSNVSIDQAENYSTESANLDLASTLSASVAGESTVAGNLDDDYKSTSSSPNYYIIGGGLVSLLLAGLYFGYLKKFKNSKYDLSFINRFRN